jgi:general secretion pathway protein G
MPRLGAAFAPRVETQRRRKFSTRLDLGRIITGELMTLMTTPHRTLNCPQPRPAGSLTLAPARRRARAFTLIEMMLVLGIIVVLMGVGIRMLIGNRQYAQEVAAEAQLQHIQTQLQTYETFNLRLPTTAQGLKALVEKPSTQPVPKRWKQLLTELKPDPWGNPYQYRNPGTRNKDGYDLFSFGPDGVESGDDISLVGK